jgi:hypothetical protein
MGIGKGLLIAFSFMIVSFVANAQTYATGNYIGNGTSKAITGLGFSPECVMIKSNGAYSAVIRTSNMDANETKDMGSTATACATGQITSLDADGFTVGSGTSTNVNAIVYQYIAWNESTNLHIGTYAGNGSTGVATGCGWTPDAYLIWGDEAAAAGDVRFGSQTQAGGTKANYVRDGSSAGANFSSWDGGGFTFSGGTGAISNAVNYYYIAFNNSGTTIKESSYSCGGFDNSIDRTFTDMGFQPDFLLIYSFNALATPVFRIGSVAAATDKSFKFTATAGLTGRIKAFTASGFTAGASQTEVMVSWQTQHYYLATSGGTALPVQLTSFEAQKDGENVQLHWQTGSEINSDHFEIMHSTDGTNFELMGSVPAAGSSNTWLDYEFYHETPGRGIHYYQLVEFDQDGSSEKFKTLTVNFNDAFNIITQLYPNPASNNLNMYYNSEKGGTYQLNIADVNGMSVYHAQIPTMIGNNKFLLPLSSYANGTYFITLSDPANNKSTVQFVKQD